MKVIFWKGDVRRLGPLAQERKKQKTVPQGSDPTKPGTEVNYRVSMPGSSGFRGKI